jgi:hypothetical protein
LISGSDEYEVIYEATFEVKRFLGQTATVTPKGLK